MNKQSRESILLRLQQYNPNPTTELNYRTPFELLVSVMLSAQSTDINVNKVTNSLYIVANTPQAIYDLGLDNLKNYIKSIGLYNNKAINIIKTCRVLLDKHQGKVPENRQALEELPGVGRKTSNVILNTVFGWPVIAVDTHVFRVANRTNFSPGKTIIAVEKGLIQVVPEAFKKNCHHWFVLHGRYVCKAKKPLCRNCRIVDLCEWSENPFKQHNDFI